MTTPDSMPLIKALKKRHKLKTVPFHMPGHKMGKGINPGFARLMKKDPFALDLTEIPGLDDLHNPEGPIREAQARAARLFGANHTFFLVNGTTVGIHAAILATCRENDEILLPRDVHRSVIGACILAGVRPRYLPLRLHPDFSIAYPTKPEEVAAVLESGGSIKAVMQVYPSYYGLAGDLAGVVKVADRYDVPVIVDEAHGAHFGFSEQLPPTALQEGADVTVQSTHKTLGAFTQASMLHLAGKKVKYDDVAGQLRILQSTSPSYLLMASLDAAVGHLETSGNRLVAGAVTIAKEAKNRINDIPGFKCLDNDLPPGSGAVSCDPTKLYVSTKDLKISGYDAAERLLKKYRIQVEMCDHTGFLCMFSIGNTRSDADRLVRALQEMAGARKRKNKRVGPAISEFPAPRVVQTPRQAWFSPKKAIPLGAAVGEIAAEIVAPYPPGIPILCPGEEITPEIIDIIRQLKAENVSFHGPRDPELNFITVVS